eukprot:GHVH01003618.1.p1 GENE.GHVH01003618.1~~GHVH01003618.1.p1  ORF type:complete len:836 (+),score=143.29 GHVH01003618.1:1246-3753(+)
MAQSDQECLNITKPFVDFETSKCDFGFGSRTGARGGKSLGNVGGHYKCMTANQKAAHVRAYGSTRDNRMSGLGVNAKFIGTYSHCVVCNPYLGHEKLIDRWISTNTQMTYELGTNGEFTHSDYIRVFDFNEKDEAINAKNLSNGVNPYKDEHTSGEAPPHWNTEPSMLHPQDFNVAFHASMTSEKDPFESKQLYPTRGDDATVRVENFPFEQPMGVNRMPYYEDHFTDFSTFKFYIDSLSEFWIKTNWNPGTDRMNYSDLKTKTGLSCDGRINLTDCLFFDNDQEYNDKYFNSAWHRRGKYGLKISESPSEHSFCRYVSDSARSALFADRRVPQGSCSHSSSLTRVHSLEDLLQLDWSDIIDMGIVASITPGFPSDPSRIFEYTDPFLRHSGTSGLHEGAGSELKWHGNLQHMRVDPRVMFYYYRVCPRGKDFMVRRSFSSRKLKVEQYHPEGDANRFDEDWQWERARPDTARDDTNYCYITPDGFATGGEVLSAKTFSGVPVAEAGLGVTAFSQDTYTEGALWFSWHFYTVLDQLEEALLRLDDRMNALGYSDTQEVESIIRLNKESIEVSTGLYNVVASMIEDAKRTSIRVNSALDDLEAFHPEYNIDDLIAMGIEEREKLAVDANGYASDYSASKIENDDSWNSMIEQKKVQIKTDAETMNDADVALSAVRLVAQASNEAILDMTAQSAEAETTEWLNLLEEVNNSRETIYASHLLNIDTIIGKHDDLIASEQYGVDLKEADVDELMNSLLTRNADSQYACRTLRLGVNEIQKEIRHDVDLHTRTMEAIIDKTKRQNDKMQKQEEKDFNLHRKLKKRMEADILLKQLKKTGF